RPRGAPPRASRSRAFLAKNASSDRLNTGVRPAGAPRSCCTMTRTRHLAASIVPVILAFAAGWGDAMPPPESPAQAGAARSTREESPMAAASAAPQAYGYGASDEGGMSRPAPPPPPAPPGGGYAPEKPM